MWTLYDELIEGIPAEMTVDRLVCGAYQTLVVSGGGYGICNTLNDTRRPDLIPRRPAGMKLRDLAVCAKSFNFVEASIGIAALNAYYNEIDRVRALGIDIPDALHVEDRSYDPFITYQNDIKGKNVTVIGHFPYIDQLFAPVCNLSIIEKFRPERGDYPEQAAEYLLPESDYVFISSYTFAEKSLPRFLQLAGGAHVTVVGPAVTMSPALFRYGADDLSGFVVKDGENAEKNCLGLGGSMHAVGQKVSVKGGSA